jgi:NADPH-dependent 2,4-dienoyl-CoA reductase/sulfur reductase-like enzyme
LKNGGNMMQQRLVVIGGTAAGLSAASRAKRLRPDLEVEVFERTGYVSYGACGLPYLVGDVIRDPEELIALTPQQLREGRGMLVHTRHEVIKIDRKAKTVEVVDLETGRKRSANYTYLVIAAGAAPIIPPIPGTDAKGVHVLRTVEDGISLKRRLHDSSVTRAVIIGGGFIGLELAGEITRSGVAVTIVEALQRLLPFLTEDFSVKVQRTLTANGVAVLTGTSVAAIETSAGRVTGIRAAGGKKLECELVVVAAGVRPNSQLAAAAGLTLGLKDGIVVNERLQTSDANIWACGDCVQMVHRVTGEPVYVPLGTTANKQGRIAGANIGGADEIFRGVLASQVTKVFDLYIASTGLSMEQARDAGYTTASTTIAKKDKASYYPGGEENHIFLLFDKTSGRLLGAQGLGGISVAGRMNVLATAITAKMTVPELNELDLVYAPPVAPVYDPILIAASQALKQVNR